MSTGIFQAGLWSFTRAAYSRTPRSAPWRSLVPIAAPGKRGLAIRACLKRPLAGPAQSRLCRFDVPHSPDFRFPVNRDLMKGGIFLRLSLFHRQLGGTIFPLGQPYARGSLYPGKGKALGQPFGQPLRCPFGLPLGRVGPAEKIRPPHGGPDNRPALGQPLGQSMAIPRHNPVTIV